MYYNYCYCIFGGLGSILNNRELFSVPTVTKVSKDTKKIVKGVFCNGEKKWAKWQVYTFLTPESNLSSYKTNDSINEPFPTDRKKFYTLKTIDGNQVYITFASSDFKTYKDYIQACYDVFYEIVSKYKSEELKSKIAFIESYKMPNVLYESIYNGDYKVLFDAVMNHAVAIVALDGNIHTRIEFSTMQIDDNTIIDVLEIRKSYLFDTNNVM